MMGLASRRPGTPFPTNCHSGDVTKMKLPLQRAAPARNTAGSGHAFGISKPINASR